MKTTILRLLLIFFTLSVFMSSKSLCDSSITFIINQKNPVSAITVNEIIEFYKKQKRHWPDGEPVRFVDRNSGSPERQTFLIDILKQSATDVDLFWFGEKLHSGNSMPIQVSTDFMVMEIVRSFTGAIGYISSSTPISDNRVKAVKVSP